MAESNWKVRIMLFVRAADNTAQNRQAFADIFVNNGSMETTENEGRLFDSAIRLSATGADPVQALALETALLLPPMRDAMRAFLDTLPQARYYVIANIDTAQYTAGDFIDSNKVGLEWSGAFTMQDALADIETERGLVVIPDA
jgi:hypothetical protein